MLAMNESQFSANSFSVQMISKGAFVDYGIGHGGEKHIVEATILRVNEVALHAWLNAHTLDTRDCFEEGPAGDAEWQAVLEKSKSDLAAFEAKVKAAIGIETDKNAFVGHAHSEMFTVVSTYKV